MGRGLANEEEQKAIERMLYEKENIVDMQKAKAAKNRISGLRVYPMSRQDVDS